MAAKVHQFPGTQPAPQAEPEVDTDAQLVNLKAHFDEVVKEVLADPGLNTSILTVLTTDTCTTTFIQKLGQGMDLPGLSLGLLRAQRVLSEQGD